MSTSKERLDVLLVKKGLIETREKAKKAIMAGLVYVNQQKVDKAGAMVHPDDILEIRGNAVPYVSRGGLKLEKALNFFDVSVEGKVFLDVGASTGGFTHCLLENGAKKVYAIDVGYGQLDWRLRQDNRVVVMERTNIRYVTPADLGEAADGAVIDVSFISLKIVLPAVKNLLKSDSPIIALIKPQFEAGREKVGKKGVVRDPRIHKEVLEDIVAFCLGIGLEVKQITYSPITGPEGNIEFLIHLHYGPGATPVHDASLDIEGIVKEAHRQHFNK